MISKYVKSLGVELEGAIEPQKRREFERYCQEAHLVNDLEWHSDGSVHTADYLRGDYKNIEITFWSDDIRKIFLTVKKLYEKYGFKTDKSCGLHNHMKFANTSNVIAFLSNGRNLFCDFEKAYHDYADAQPTDAGKTKYLNRLDPRSTGQWCKFDYSTREVESQLYSNQKTNARYHAINLNAYPVHGTLELRELPYASNYAEFKKEIFFNLKTLDGLLDKYKNKTAVSHALAIPETEDMEQEPIKIPIYDIGELKKMKKLPS